jgi:ferrous iron transport protein B
MKKFTIALAGNPNSGKTTLFNALTGSDQRVGNWPGVTVEKKEGDYRSGDKEITVVDLPGIYSFSAYSPDEKVAREFVLREKPDLVVNIVDASNLERNLYLTTQLIEMKAPVLVALNMMDIVRRRKIKIEVEHLAKHLDCPVIPIAANRSEGMKDLLSKIDHALESRNISSSRVEYDETVEDAIRVISEKAEDAAKRNSVDTRWLSIKLLEKDELASTITGDTVKDIVASESKKIQRHIGEEADIAVADGRYGFIHGLSADVINRQAELSRNISDILDKVVLNRIIGIPIFLVVMYLVFVITMNIGGPFIDFFDGLCGTIFVDGLRYLLEGWHFPAFLVTFLADGVGGGIQTVATFIPPIALIFLCLSILEDSGYMARAAFVMDRLLRTIGLPGKAFIPMLVGLGCNVPGIMATRTLESQRDRVLSIMINPLISCGARLPIYALFAAVFFKENAGLMLFAIYAIGATLAILMGLLFGKTILKGEVSTFVMELPPYHIPTFSGIYFHTWNRLKAFLFRAGKVIISVVIILSFLNSIGTDGSFGNQDSKNSVLSAMGRTITPVFRPMGLTDDNWPATVGLFTGLFAKEAVVGTLNSLYAGMDEVKTNEDATETAEAEECSEDEFNFWGSIKDAFLTIPAGYSGFLESLLDPLGLKATSEIAKKSADEAAEELEVEKETFVRMRQHFPNRAAAFAYLLFILIYVPCLAAIAAVYRETNLRWTVFSVAYLAGLAWVIATIFYQISRISVSPRTALPWVIFCILVLIAFVVGLRRAGGKNDAPSI